MKYSYSIQIKKEMFANDEEFSMANELVRCGVVDAIKKYFELEEEEIQVE